MQRSIYKIRMTFANQIRKNHRLQYFQTQRQRLLDALAEKDKILYEQIQCEMIKEFGSRQEYLRFMQESQQYEESQLYQYQEQQKWSQKMEQWEREEQERGRQNQEQLRRLIMDMDIDSESSDSQDQEDLSADKCQNQSSIDVEAANQKIATDTIAEEEKYQSYQYKQSSHSMLGSLQTPIQIEL